MLVLLVILVPTVNVYADTYTTKDDIVIDTKYYEFFKSKFGEFTSYKFFAYNCTRSNYSYNTTCYYGIDSSNNYVKISYVDDSLNVSTGIDENFALNGSNYIDVKPSVNAVFCTAFVFAFTLSIFLVFLRELW